MKKFTLRRLTSFLLTAGVLALSMQVFASGFQLWEEDGASIGNYHAGYAAIAEDASTAFYNPAGMVLIKNQQLVVGGTAFLPDFKYQGTVAVSNLLLDPVPQTVTAQGGVFAFVPYLHFVTPVNDRMNFGFSADVPFGLETNFGRSTALRYASILASVKVIDLSPTIAFQFTDKTSFGIGPDFQRMSVEFDQMAILDDPSTDTLSTNRADDTAWGYHLGGLYQFTPQTRIGLSYHSQVVHHLSRRSTFSGPIMDILEAPPMVSRATANITLPPYTALSLFHQMNEKWAFMGSVIYTQWSSVKNIIMKNLAGIDADIMPSTNIVVIIPQFFRNTWNATIGANYYPTDRIILRAGFGYDQTPVQNKYRTVHLPDNNRYAVALGGHYQAGKKVGIDVGWTHFFIAQAAIHPPTQITGAQHVETNGQVNGGADVYGVQVTWDMT